VAIGREHRSQGGQQALQIGTDPRVVPWLRDIATSDEGVSKLSE
jgi:hypothetical protein